MTVKLHTNYHASTVVIEKGVYAEALPEVIRLAAEWSELRGEPVIITLPRQLTGGLPTIRIAADTSLVALKRDIQRSLRGYLRPGMVVGPHPSLVLSDEERAADMALEAERRAQYEAMVARQAAKRQTQIDAVKTLLESASAMERDEVAWQCWRDSQQGEGSHTQQVMELVERWARRIQIELAAGVANAWSSYMHEVDFDRLLPESRELAWEILRDCWLPARWFPPQADEAG